MIQNYQHVLAMVFAIKEINENPKLLPNYTMGFHIYDNCLNVKRTYYATLKLLSPWNRLVPNFRCDMKHNLFAIMEDFASASSYLIPSVWGMYKIPQVGYVCKTI